MYCVVNPVVDNAYVNMLRRHLSERCRFTGSSILRCPISCRQGAHERVEGVYAQVHDRRRASAQRSIQFIGQRKRKPKDDDSAPVAQLDRAVPS